MAGEEPFKTYCRATQNFKGNSNYDCKKMGGQFEEYNPVSIVFAEYGSGSFKRTIWEVRKNMSAAEYITITAAGSPPRLGKPIDYVQIFDNVCIPAWNADGSNFGMDLKYNGFLKCRDNPSPPTMAQTTATTVTTLPSVAPAPVGLISNMSTNNCCNELYVSYIILTDFRINYFYLAQDPRSRQGQRAV